MMWPILLVPVVLISATVALGRWRFARASRRAVKALLARAASAPSAPLLAAELEALPEIVRAWVRRSGALGRPRPRVVHLRQRGEMQPTRGGRWMRFEAEQWFTPTRPGFVWVADVKAAPAVHLAGRDALLDGRGSMRIELFSLIPVVDARGSRVDQGAQIRYLAEMVWLPAHATAPYLRWESIDATSARATLTLADDDAVSGVFTFTADGDLLSFTARRYREATLEDWRIDVPQGGHGELGGLRLPLRASVTWGPSEGAAEAWTWLRLEVFELDADAPAD